MPNEQTNDHHAELVRELCKLPGESEWVEFKGNNTKPESIGENISALANSAALEGKAHAYIVWGPAPQLWTPEYLCQKCGGRLVKVHVCPTPRMDFINKNFAYK